MSILSSVWRKIGSLGVQVHYDSGKAKRIRMTNYVSVLGALLVMPHLFKYHQLGLSVAVMIQIATVALLLLIPLLNRFGYHLSTRYLLFLGCAGSTMMTSALMGFSSGENLPFVILVLFSFVLFDIRQEVWHLVIIECLLIAAFFVVELGWVPIESIAAEMGAQAIHKSYISNLLTTIGLAILIAYYFQSLSNRQVDDIIYRAKRQLQSVFDHSYDAIILLDMEGAIIKECNLRSLEIFQREKKEELIGSSCQLLHTQAFSPSRLQYIFDRLKNRKKWSEELLFSGLGEADFWGNIAYTILGDEGPDQLLIRITDITAQKQSEQEILAAKEKAEAANRAKTYFLANMSHELRTPINGVIGLGEIIQSEYEDEELTSYADLLLESGQRLLRTVSSVLDLSKLESGAEELHVEAVDLTERIHQVSRPFFLEAKEKGLDFSFRGMDQPQLAQVDPALFDKVIEHLLGNAVKFTQTGGVEISLFHQHLPRRRPEVLIQVKDTGIGMSQEFIQQKLFMKFEQESEGLDRNYEGSGLGLSITKRIIELLDGSIEVKSARRKGTKITISLPDSCAQRVLPAGDLPTELSLF